MTLNGAIMQLVEMRENSMMPEVFKPYFDKVIETFSECEERIFGEWETVPSSDHGIDFRCSACHRYRFHNGEMRKRYKYCPNCGADMRGDKHE